ncbi:MAG TPA: class I adenylate-forming enzyme family protein [Egibacteraceae bacterium]|nr:class I adenylate-forming enzyme family protein [Egibacteraceae bacterium]
MSAPLSPSLEEACLRWSSRPAVTFEGTTITYETLWDRVVALARAYERLGVGRGDRVLCQLRNGPEHVVAVAAAWLRGAVHVGADNDLTGRELSRLVERLDAAALLFQPAKDATDPLAPLRVVADVSPSTRLIVHGAASGPHHSLAELLEEDGTVSADLPGPLDPAVIFLTSGTTGEPKAVVETLLAHWAKMQFFTDAFAPGPDDVHLLYLPIAHVFGLRLALLALLRGGRLVLMERFSPDRALDLVGRERVTVMPAVPAHLRLLRSRYHPGRHDVSSLRWVLSAASNLPSQLAQWVYDTLDARILYVFGCSEGFTTRTTDPADILAGSVGNTVFRGPPGTPADGTVRILDPSEGTPLPAGETGEIAFGAAVPVPYWDHPAAATDGWYRTGDLGRLDDEGRLYVVGRLKELINRAGLHVSAAEVEMALVRHPGVADAGVIAAPDPVVGEAVCACVTPADSQPPSLEELRRFLADTLARHKLPDELCIVDAIPRTVIGKVDRRALAARVVAGDAPRERHRR